MFCDVLEWVCVGVGVGGVAIDQTNGKAYYI